LQIFFHEIPLVLTQCFEVADFAELLIIEVKGNVGFCEATKSALIASVAQRQSIAKAVVKDKEKVHLEEDIKRLDCYKAYESGLSI